MGNENFPSVKSSANPLFVVYYCEERSSGYLTGFSQYKGYLCALQIAIVVADLKEHADEIHERNEITEK
jgi:hypothetical protein